jgi:hypothetical protein
MLSTRDAGVLREGERAIATDEQRLALGEVGSKSLENSRNVQIRSRLLLRCVSGQQVVSACRSAVYWCARVLKKGGELRWVTGVGPSLP